MLPYLRKQRMAPTLAEFIALLEHRSLSLPADLQMALPAKVRLACPIGHAAEMPVRAVCPGTPRGGRAPLMA